MSELLYCKNLQHEGDKSKRCECDHVVQMESEYTRCGWVSGNVARCLARFSSKTISVVQTSTTTTRWQSTAAADETLVGAGARWTTRMRTLMTWHKELTLISHTQTEQKVQNVCTLTASLVKTFISRAVYHTAARTRAKSFGPRGEGLKCTLAAFRPGNSFWVSGPNARNF